MTGIWPVLKKDFSSYCRSWVGVLSMTSFLFLAGIFFTLFLLSYNQYSLEMARRSEQVLEGINLTGFILGGVFLNLGVVLIFLAPLLSMRSLAEEKRVGTLELLYTYPLGDMEIVLGKYFSLLAQLLLLFLPTLSYVGLMKIFGINVDLKTFAGGVLGFFLLGSAFLAMGLFFSSLTENQIIAAGLTFAFLLGFWIMEWLTGFLPHPWNLRLATFSPFIHFRDFSFGIIDLTALTYFFAMIALFLFMSLRVVETRNWNG